MPSLRLHSNIEINMLETEGRLFKKFLDSHENIVVKTASDVTKCYTKTNCVTYFWYFQN